MKRIVLFDRTDQVFANSKYEYQIRRSDLDY